MARIRSDYKVLLLRRSTTTGSFRGMAVFPGGVVDDAVDSKLEEVWQPMFEALKDSPVDAELVQQCWQRERNLALESEEARWQLVSKMTAIRELFEESGILLFAPARNASLEKDFSGGDCNGKNAVDSTGEPLGDILSRLKRHEWRHCIHENAGNLVKFCQQYGVVPDIRILPWDRWIAPVQEPKRFDARFFIVDLHERLSSLSGSDTGDAIAEMLSNTTHDGQETISSVWYHPEEALHEFTQGNISLAPPTFYMLREMSQCTNLRDLMKIAEHRTIGSRMPNLVKVERHYEQDGSALRTDPMVVVALPGDPLHHDTVDPPSARKHRIELRSKHDYVVVDERKLANEKQECIESKL